MAFTVNTFFSRVMVLHVTRRAISNCLQRVGLVLVFVGVRGLLC